MKKFGQSFLDGEKLFRQYFLMGDGASAKRLQRFAVSSGMLSPEGREPTVMGCWKAMWRWASLKENKDTAFSIFLEHYKKRGWKNFDPDLTWDGDPQELWKQFMLQKIQSAYQFNRRRHERFLKENGWL